MTRGHQVSAALLAACIALAPNPARAEAPACFAERTVLRADELVDAAGKRLAGVRAGQRVRVLDDRVGPRGRKALVAIDKPIRLVGRLERDSLQVFARVDLAVVPDRVWWLAGRALRIERGNGARATVTWGEPEANEAPYPALSVACGDLSGVPGTPLDKDACEGAEPALDLAPGNPHVSWRPAPRVTIDMLGGAGRGNWGYDVHDARLLERSADRVWVEAKDSGHGVRFRAWLPSAGMRPGPSNIGRGSCGGCCLGELARERGFAAGRAPAPVALYRTPQAAQPFATLPAQASLRWHEIDGERVRVSWFWPRADLDDYTFVVEGWAHRKRLPAGLQNVAEQQVHGRVLVPPSLAGSGPLTVIARSIDSPDPLTSWSAPVDPQGRFVLSAGQSDLTLQARSADGSLVSQPVRAEAWPGGSDESSLELTPALRVQGHAVDEAGRPVAGAIVSVFLETPSVAHDLALSKTDHRGRFELSLPPGAHSVRVADYTGDRFGHADIPSTAPRDRPFPLGIRVQPRDPIPRFH